MSTATASTDRIVSQPQRERVFTARREDLRLVKTARYPILNGQGAKTGLDTEGITIQFRAGLLRVPLEGEVETEHGAKIDAAELNEWLDRHRLNGDRFEGFVQLEQTAPPVSAEEMKALIRLGQAFDREGLEALIEMEREGWNRSELIESAEESIQGIRRLEEEAAAQAAAQAKPAAKKTGQG
jgi:hypothetical protein